MTNRLKADLVRAYGVLRLRWCKHGRYYKPHTVGDKLVLQNTLQRETAEVFVAELGGLKQQLVPHGMSLKLIGHVA